MLGGGGDGACSDTDESSCAAEETAQVQEAYTVAKSRTFYVSNPKTSANNFTGKSFKLSVNASIPTGGKIKSIQFFDMTSLWSEMYISCSGTTSCTATTGTLPGGCRNYGTVPVVVQYTYDSASVKTPSLSYWFTDCK
jgi:hypothetical protein